LLDQLVDRCAGLGCDVAAAGVVVQAGPGGENQKGNVMLIPSEGELFEKILGPFTQAGVFHEVTA
jgi:hypothetical protein